MIFQFSFSKKYEKYLYNAKINNDVLFVHKSSTLTRWNNLRCGQIEEKPSKYPNKRIHLYFRFTNNIHGSEYDICF